MRDLLKNRGEAIASLGMIIRCLTRAQQRLRLAHGSTAPEQEIMSAFEQLVTIDVIKPPTHLRTCLDLSTSHVAREPDEMDDDPDFGALRYAATEHGWIVWLSDDVNDAPEWMQDIAKLGAKYGCLLINFDRDADEVEGLQVYDW